MKKIIVALILFFICSFAVLNNCFWLKHDGRPRGIDVPNHLLGQLNFHYSFSEIMRLPVSCKEKASAVISLLGSSMFSPHNVYWPNLVYLYSSFFTSIFGASLFVTRLTMSGFFIILIIAVYYFGKILKDNHTGLLAAFLISMYPMVFGVSRQYGLDLPLTAMTTLTILLLILSSSFTKTSYSLAAGICLGLGFLVKGQIILFLLGPVAITSLHLFQKGQNLKKIFNFYLFAIACILIGIIWWDKGRFVLMVYNLKLHIFSYLKGREGNFQGNNYSFKYFVWHLKDLTFSALGVFFSAAFFISLFYFLRGRVRHKLTLLLWLLIPLFLFSAVFLLKQGRFLMPVLPAVALVSAYGISGINNQMLKKCLIYCVIFFGLSSFFLLSYSKKFYLRAGILSVLSGKNDYNWFPEMDDGAALIVTEIADKISADNSGQSPVYIGTIYTTPEIPCLAPNEFFYRMRLIRRNVYMFDLVENMAEFSEKFPSFAYLIFVSDNENPYLLESQDTVKLMKEKYPTFRREIFESAEFLAKLEKISSVYADFYPYGQKKFSGGEFTHHIFIYKRKK